MWSLLRNLVVPLCIVPLAMVPATADKPTQAEAPTQTELARKKFVLLKNGEFLHGAVDREIDYVVVDDGKSRFKIRRDQVIFVGNDKTALYQYKRSQAKDHSADAQLDLVKWCTDSDFIAAAVHHLAKARYLQPNHPWIPALQLRLQAKIEDRGGFLPKDPTSSPASQDDTEKPLPGSKRIVSTQSGSETDTANEASQTAQHQTANAPGAPDPSAISLAKSENTRALLRHFSSRVQPVLLNRCALAHCHGHAADNGFALRRVPGISQQPRDITIHNLTATMQYMAGSTPDETELIRRATTAHGKSTSKLLTISAKQRNLLAIWIGAVIQENGGTLNGIDPANIAGGVPFSAPQTLTPPSIVASKHVQPVTENADGATDPFDPAIFNREEISVVSETATEQVVSTTDDEPSTIEEDGESG